MITVKEAHNRFGDLARIRNGVTHWIIVETPEGQWKPVYNAFYDLIGYEFVPEGFN